MNQAAGMRWCVALAVTAVLVTGCKQQVPRQQKMSDAEISLMHREFPGMTDECLEKAKWGGTQALPHREDQCFKFSAPTRMQGLWRNQFEGSEYCDGSRHQCPVANEDPASFVLLEMRPPLPGLNDTPPGGLYAIDFVGRRSVGAGGFGNGLVKNEVIVDRIISIREIKPPPPQATKAEIIKEMKACEAKRACNPSWSYINGYNATEEKKRRVEAYLKDCADKPICMPNSEVPERK